MKLLVTGSSGLVGSEVVAFFGAAGHEIHGVDNNMRADFFGAGGDTRWRQRRLQGEHPTFRHHEIDVRDRARLASLVMTVRPDAIVHAAAQPSHDLAASRPHDDFDVNAVGTLNLLEAARQHVPEAVFVHLSTNKVYGDAPNRIPLAELPTRWDYAEPRQAEGIDETLSIDQSMHSVFGASKVAADVMVQEYGRYFGMRTCCLRAGCLTGPNHAGVELHGFLSYLVRTQVAGGTYRIYGYGGKQVRDNLHAIDIARFIAAFIERPRVGEVYNLGGGRKNSCSILEALADIAARTGKEARTEYVERARNGDHVCYITNLRKARSHYPEWDVSISLPQILDEIVAGWRQRGTAEP
jgi:CDP-paratose 2-epimerase